MKPERVSLGVVCECGNRAGAHIVNGATISVGFSRGKKLKKTVSISGLGRCSACGDCKQFQRRNKS